MQSRAKGLKAHPRLIPGYRARLVVGCGPVEHEEVVLKLLQGCREVLDDVVIEGWRYHHILPDSRAVSHA